MIATHLGNVKYGALTFLKEACTYGIEKQASDVSLWKKVVNEFTYKKDGTNNGWRGEYWGKLMRGACVLQKLTEDDKLYCILEDTVRDIITRADENGRISSYDKGTEYHAWDLWFEKFVMLGLIYFLDICRDEALRIIAVDTVSALADTILAKIGKEEGKTEIYHATDHWCGLNSSSILEPFVLLYDVTKEKKYLDFASYIVESGMASSFDLPKTALEDKLCPYQYPVTKAYEMMSCVEGLLEYSRITNNDRYVEAAKKYAKRIMESDVTVIGSCGCTHELFDNSAVRQTYTKYDGIMQETCVTVTWMKLCSKLLMITGDSIYADEMERSYYNAYLGSLNKQGNSANGALPYDSYAPLLYSSRGRVVGGRQELGDGGIYGCCAAIASLGAGMFAYGAVMSDSDSIYLNFYDTLDARVSFSDGNITVTEKTEYPKEGDVTVSLISDRDCKKTVKVRIPSWCGNAMVSYGGKNNKALSGYFSFEHSFVKNEELIVEISMEMKLKYISSPRNEDDPDSVNFFSLSKGPVVFAVSSDITGDEIGGDIPIDIKLSDDLTAEYTKASAVDCNESLNVTDKNGKEYKLVDYASAGSNWDNGVKAAAWIRQRIL